MFGRIACLFGFHNDLIIEKEIPWTALYKRHVCKKCGSKRYFELDGKYGPLWRKLQGNPEVLFAGNYIFKEDK